MTRRLSRLRQELRQRRHHRAFRIAPPVWDEPLLDELERLLAAIAPAGPDKDAPRRAGAGDRAEDEHRPRAAPAGGAGEASGEEPSATGSAQPPEHSWEPPAVDEKALAEAATSLWRAQRRLAREGEKSTPLSRQTGRYLRSCREALAEAGVVVQDHEGDAFHPGRSLEVLVFQDDPELTTEKVLETIRPSVYFRDRRIQMGQVIVGCPVKDTGDKDTGGRDTGQGSGAGTGHGIEHSTEQDTAPGTAAETPRSR